MISMLYRIMSILWSASHKYRKVVESVEQAVEDS